MAVVDIAARKRELWEANSNAERFALEIEAPGGAQRLRDAVELDIIQRYRWGETILDAGIGTGRLAIPLACAGAQITGIDPSAAMIERCRERSAGSGVEIVPGQLEKLPFAARHFDTAISIDTFAHFPEWTANLDELLRVVKPGGRVIVDLGSREHIDAVAAARGSRADAIRAAELGCPDDFLLRLSAGELQAFAAKRGATLIDVVPIGAVFGSLIPNYWQAASFAYQSGALDRLVSWIGGDRALFEFAEFIERRIIQALHPAAAGRMFAVFERSARARAYREPALFDVRARDERGAENWQAELDVHMQHEPNRSFAIGLLLAMRPVLLPAVVRRELPVVFIEELARAEWCAEMDERVDAAAVTWAGADIALSFRGVDLAAAFAPAIAQTLFENWDRPQ